MKKRTISSPKAPGAVGGYAQAVETTGAERVLYISGQVPLDLAGSLPASFREQCRLAWANVAAQLEAADMTLDNLVKVTMFLGDRRYAAENRAIRQEVLGARAPALTVIIAGIFDEAWLIEIEAIAAA
ncbi:MAG: RidA family protein [Alphaproteobacteria bacterium]|nr:RidA family protein [Alphaproteobacteria bacterium]